MKVTDLGVALEFLKKTLVRKAVKTAQTKIELGLGQKGNFRNVLRNLKCKKAKMSSSCA